MMSLLRAQMGDYSVTADNVSYIRPVCQTK